MARRHWDADWLPTFVFNTLHRVTVVFAPLFSASHAHSKCVFCVLRAQQVLRLGTMVEGHDAPPTSSQANT